MPLPGMERFAANTRGSCPRDFSSCARPSVTISTPARWSGKNWWAAKRTFTLDTSAQEEVQLGRDLRRASGEPAVLRREVGASLGDGGKPRCGEREPRGAQRRLLLVPAHAQVKIDRGAERIQEQECQAWSGREAEEVEEETPLHVVAAQVVEGAAFVRVEHRRAWFVDELVSRLNDPLAPPQVLPEDRPLEGYLLQHRAAHARAHVVEGGERSALRRGQRVVARRRARVLLPALAAGSRPPVHEGAGQGAAVRVGYLAPVDTGDPFVCVQVLDHRGKPVFV